MTFFIWDTIKPILEIAILWIVFYRTLVFFEGTRAFQVLKGMTYLLIAFLVSQILGFDTLNWLLTKFFAISIIGVLIIFQQELRQGLARLGQQHLFTVTLEEAEIMAVIEQTASAVYRMGRQNIGCLIAIERETKLNIYIESGMQINAKLSAELLQSIFAPQSPLHDGGVIVRSDRVMSASCLFPLSENPNLSKIVGTRHRAALGITEQTDSVVIVVSEQSGEISISCDGRFIPVSSRERFSAVLKDFLVSDIKKKKGKN